jgi:hypothetical protein
MADGLLTIFKGRYLAPGHVPLLYYPPVEGQTAWSA